MLRVLVLAQPNKKDGINFYLMSGKDALKAENMITLFERIKGRPVTDEERATFEKRCAAFKAKHLSDSRQQ